MSPSGFWLLSIYSLKRIEYNTLQRSRECDLRWWKTITCYFHYSKNIGAFHGAINYYPFRLLIGFSFALGFVLKWSLLVRSLSSGRSQPWAASKPAEMCACDRATLRTTTARTAYSVVCGCLVTSVSLAAFVVVVDQEVQKGSEDWIEEVVSGSFDIPHR